MKGGKLQRYSLDNRWIFACFASERARAQAPTWTKLVRHMISQNGMTNEGSMGGWKRAQRGMANNRHRTLSAGVRLIIRNRPSVSTAIWRLRPTIFLPASYPLVFAIRMEHGLPTFEKLEMRECIAGRRQGLRC
jgi:hypothetical protein